VLHNESLYKGKYTSDIIEAVVPAARDDNHKRYKSCFFF